MEQVSSTHAIVEYCPSRPQKLQQFDLRQSCNSSNPRPTAVHRDAVPNVTNSFHDLSLQWRISLGVQCRDKSRPSFLPLPLSSSPSYFPCTSLYGIPGFTTPIPLPPSSESPTGECPLKQKDVLLQVHLLVTSHKVAIVFDT